MLKPPSFSHFETLAERLVEGSFQRLFRGRIQLHDLALLLARTLEDNQRHNAAANQYQIHLHPETYTTLHDETPDIIAQLSDYLSQLAQQAQVVLAGPLQLDFVSDAQLRPQKIIIHAQHSQPYQDETTRVRRHELVQETLAAIADLDAFLIVDGKQHIPLQQPVISLGRRTDNDIVLSHPDVSRQHAQIRWRFGRYVIYDLGSRAGTVVNSHKVQECALHPGDIIALSYATLIYGEGNDGQVNRRHVSSTPKDEATLVRMKPVSRPKQ